jgi:hypothetical protein
MKKNQYDVFSKPLSCLWKNSMISLHIAQHKRINKYVSPSTKRLKLSPSAGSRVERARFTHPFTFHLRLLRTFRPVQTGGRR